jgi:hypothetical protein
MNRLATLLLALVLLLILDACGGFQAAPPVPTATRFIAFTLPPSWTPEPTQTRAPTKQFTKAPPTATASVTPTFRPFVPPPTRTPQPTLADPSKSTISGTVLDSVGKPMPNIKVELAAQAALTKLLQSATSGADGRFELTNVAPGGYRVQTTLVSFKTKKCVATSNITVSAGGQRLVVNLRFAPTCT